MNSKKILPSENQQELLEILKTRFEKNPKRHENIQWEDIQKKTGVKS